MIAVRAVFQCAFGGWPVLWVGGGLLWWERVLCYLLGIHVERIEEDAI